MAYSLTGITSLGTITAEDSTKDAQLYSTPLPGSDSSGSLVLDVLGTTRSITLSGTFTTADGTVSTMIGELDALCNGAQTKRTFHSDKSGSGYGVFVNSVRWSGEESGLGFVKYEITMIEAA